MDLSLSPRQEALNIPRWTVFLAALVDCYIWVAPSGLDHSHSHSLSFKQKNGSDGKIQDTMEVNVAGETNARLQDDDDRVTKTTISNTHEEDATTTVATTDNYHKNKLFRRLQEVFHQALAAKEISTAAIGIPPLPPLRSNSIRCCNGDGGGSRQPTFYQYSPTLLPSSSSGTHNENKSWRQTLQTAIAQQTLLRTHEADAVAQQLLLDDDDVGRPKGAWHKQQHRIQRHEQQQPQPTNGRSSQSTNDTDEDDETDDDASRSTPTTSIEEDSVRASLGVLHNNNNMFIHLAADAATDSVLTTTQTPKPSSSWHVKRTRRQVRLLAPAAAGSKGGDPSVPSKERIRSPNATTMNGATKPSPSPVDSFPATTVLLRETAAWKNKTTTLQDDSNATNDENREEVLLNFLEQECLTTDDVDDDDDDNDGQVSLLGSLPSSLSKLVETYAVFPPVQKHIVSDTILQHPQQTAYYSKVGHIRNKTGPRQTTPTPLNGSEETDLVPGLQARVEKLELELHSQAASYQRQLQQLSKVHQEEKDASLERVQALQLKLYIVETRLRTYGDALQQHVTTVADNIVPQRLSTTEEDSLQLLPGGRRRQHSPTESPTPLYSRRGTYHSSSAAIVASDI